MVDLACGSRVFLFVLPVFSPPLKSTHLAWATVLSVLIIIKCCPCKIKLVSSVIQHSNREVWGMDPLIAKQPFLILNILTLSNVSIV